MAIPDLSIIILSFNVKELLLDCLKSVYQNKKATDNWQIIVVDNASSDGSLTLAQDKFPQIKAIQTGKNLGFAGGNNAAIPVVKSDYILFLNPDTKVESDAIQKSLEFLKANSDYGAVGCRVELPNGKLDYSCHRGFPTPWNSFCYFSGLSTLFPKVKLFSGYKATYLDISKSHQIDCITGAFLMVKKEAGEQIKFWDTDYFWNGEDIEFCYRLKEQGWKIYYLATSKIIHYKGASSGLKVNSDIQVPKEIKIRSAKNGIEAMKIFYMKHYYKKYPPLFRDFVLLGINLLEKYRLSKIKIS